MIPIIRNHAVHNVWCTPDQDTQVIMEPLRISPLYGTKNTIKIHWETVNLPKPNVTYHVFMVGQLNPRLLNLFPAWKRWKSLEDNMNEMTMIAEFYTSKGIIIPRHRTYYHVMEDNNLLIAVEFVRRNAVEADYINDDMFLRVYSNAYFNSARSLRKTHSLRIVSRHIEFPVEVAQFQDDIAQMLEDVDPMHVTYFVNGRVKHTVDVSNTRLGDEVEFVVDESVKAIHEFRIGDTREFNSTLDRRSKYLLHPPVDPNVEPIIDYHDDTDLYLIKRTDEQFDGVRVHRNDGTSFRNVTHRDYSVGVSTVDAAFKSNPHWLRDEDLILRLLVRHSGWYRPLVADENRIQELYRLPEPKSAMIGVDSHVDVWKAANLEASAYLSLMRATSINFSEEQLGQAFGYDGLSQLLADSPKAAEAINGGHSTWLSAGLMEDATVSEYDEQGTLLGTYSHNHGLLYMFRNPNAVLAEPRIGTGSSRLDDYYDQAVVPIKPKVDFRCYSCDMNEGVPTFEWEDVTGSSQYIFKDGSVQWATGDTKFTLVRTNLRHLFYETMVTPISGVYRFSLRQQSRLRGVTRNHVMDIPMGELDIYVNGRHLIEDLDYTVRGPEIIVHNIVHLKQPGKPNRFTIRHAGFCNKDLTRTVRRDVGFIDHGLVSRNGRYNLVRNQVKQVSVGGATIHPDRLDFAEFVAPDGYLSLMNGQPYQVADVVVPFNFGDGIRTYELKEKSNQITDQIESYLSLKLPQATASTPNAIPSLYRVSSPFFTTIINDLLTGVLTDLRSHDHYDDQYVREILKPYEYLLEYDPVTVVNDTDLDYVNVSPHNLPTVMDVPISIYRLVEYAVRIYAPNRVRLSHFLRIKEID